MFIIEENFSRKNGSANENKWHPFPIRYTLAAYEMAEKGI